MSTKTPRKPMIFAENPLDNDRVDDLYARPERWDASYVPGYSELRRQNELLERDGKPQKPIPRLQWVRITGRGGEDVTSGDEAMVEWMRLGYRAMGLDDLERFGFGMPPTARVAPDGTIRRLDQALFFIDDERAEKNRIEQEILKGNLKKRSSIPSTAVRGLEVFEDESRDGKANLQDLDKLELPRLGE